MSAIWQALQAYLSSVQWGFLTSTLDLAVGRTTFWWKRLCMNIASKAIATHKQVLKKQACHFLWSLWNFPLPCQCWQRAWTLTSASSPGFSLLGLSLRDTLPHRTTPFPYLLERSQGDPKLTFLKSQTFFLQVILMGCKFHSENIYVLVRTVYV